MALNVVENVVKQGYLKKGTSGSSRISGFFKRNETNKWFVFTIRQGIPFLEYYDTDVDVFTQQPINSFNLSGCQNVKSMGNTNPPSFCIVCPDRVIELIASSRTQMVEWVNEVEASLIRLGVLQQEVVDHVYTMCPAVIQKPRISRDINNDNDEEENMSSQTAVKIIEDRKSSQAALKRSEDKRSSQTSEEKRSSQNSEDKRSSQTSVKKTDENRSSGSSHLLSPVELRSDRPSLSPKASPQSQRSTSHQTCPSSPAPSKSSSKQQSPPPLPSRQPPQPVRASNVGKGDDQHVKKPHRTEHLDSNSSNDSDFVSPEIIAQLRDSRQLKNSEIAKLRLSEENVEPSGDLNPSLHSQKRDGEGCQNQKPKLAKLQISKKGNDSYGSPPSVDDFSYKPLHCIDSNDIAGFCGVAGDRTSQENQYSDLPCSNSDSTAERLGLVCDNDDPLDSCTPFAASKPIPMPRRLSKKSTDSSSPESLTNGNLLFSSIKDNSGHSEEILNSVLSETVDNRGEKLLENIDDEYPMLVQSGRDYIDMRGKAFLSDGTNKSIMTQTVDIAQTVDMAQAHKSRKDENENFYDASPPDTMAPPIPPMSPIPPLPPRNDSLPRRNSNPHTSRSNSDAKHLGPEVKMLYPHVKLPEELVAAPPLPLPRKKASFAESVQKSHPPSAFVSNSSHEIPPMPPRRPSHGQDQSSSVNENEPPALPSRNSQSFFIKRPHANSVELPIGDNKISSNNSSGLSRKMLLDRSHSLHTVVSLKQTQADILQAEIMMASVVVQLTQKSCHGLALVAWRDSVCIVGWNQKDFPSLHGKLHVGDILLSVNNVTVTSVDMALRLLKQPNTSKVDIALHRMPYAQVFAIRKNVEGQSLGIKREGGTGEIVYVDPNGLAAQHGLTQYAPSPTGPTRCTWFLTEINNRPLNIFFKDNEIDHRLAAVGREISIVVQPSEFIFDLRHQFKKIKNYKSFITQ